MCGRWTVEEDSGWLKQETGCGEQRGLRRHRLRGNRATTTCAGTGGLRALPPLPARSSLALDELQEEREGKPLRAAEGFPWESAAGN